MRDLSYILRHTRPDCMDEYGWVPIPYLIQKIGTSKINLLMCVDDDSKNRFEVDTSENKVRARYGHTNGVEIHRSYPKANIIDGWKHATWYESYIYIQKDGFLRKMSRDCVHFANNAHCLRKRPVVLELRPCKTHTDLIASNLFKASDTVAISTIDIPVCCLHVVEG